MTRKTLLATDLRIFVLFLSVSIAVSLAMWLSPFGFARALVPAIPALCAVALFLIVRRHDRQVDYETRRDDYRQIEAWVSLQRFLASDLPLFDFREGAISPDLAAILCRELILRKPGFVVECGAGKSTLIIGYVLKRLGTGKLVTLEHDLAWASRVKSWIVQHDLGEYVSVLHSPLVQQEIEGRGAYWYNVQELRTLMEGRCDREIDFLFVDGPPEFIAPNVRSPAVMMLRKWFARSCVIVVDDANRPADMSAIQEWCRILETSSEWIATEKGTAIIHVA